jgi:hypothetical protein
MLCCHVRPAVRSCCAAQVLPVGFAAVSRHGGGVETQWRFRGTVPVLRHSGDAKLSVSCS